MAITYSDYTGDGSNTDFAFSFPYLEDTHVVVEVDGVDKTTTAGDFTLPTTSLARMAVAPVLAADVRVKRVSDFATDLVDFTNGSVLTEGDLDRAYQHNRYLNEESAEGNDASMQIVGGGTDYNAANKKIVNLADPTLTTDATNKDYVDSQVALSATNLSGFESSAHTGDNTAVDFTLSFTPQVSTPEAFIVTIDGVVQLPTTAYTIYPDTPKITFTSAPPTSAAINVVAIGKASTLANNTTVQATGGTAAVTLAARFGDALSIKDFGVNGDGTDETTAIQAGLTAAAGRTVYFPKTTNGYKVSAPVNLPANTNIEAELGAFIDATGNITGYNSTANAVLYSAGSGLGSALGGGLSAVINKGDKSISFNSPLTGVVAGDMVCLRNDTDYSWAAHRAPYKQGEFAIVESVSGTDMTLHASAIDSYSDLSTCEVKKVGTTTNYIRNLKIKGKNDDTENYAALRIQYGRGVVIDNVEIEESASSGIIIGNSLNVEIRNSRARKSSVDGAGIESTAIMLVSCQHGLISNCVAASQFHGLGITGGGDVVSRFCHAEYCQVSSQALWAVDLGHGHQEFCKVSNCRISGGAQIGANNNEISDNVFTEIDGVSTTNAIVLSETKTAEVTIRRNKFYIYNYGVLTASEANYDAFNADTTVGGTIRFNDNEIYDRREASKTYLSFHNRGCTQDIDVEVRGNVQREKPSGSFQNRLFGLQKSSPCVITGVGSGYTSKPTVTLVDATKIALTPDATFTVQLADEAIESVMALGGTGYLAGGSGSLALVFTGGGGTGATGTIAIVNGVPEAGIGFQDLTVSDNKLIDGALCVTCTDWTNLNVKNNEVNIPSNDIAPFNFNKGQGGRAFVEHNKITGYGAASTLNGTLATPLSEVRLTANTITGGTYGTCLALQYATDVKSSGNVFGNRDVTNVPFQILVGLGSVGISNDVYMGGWPLSHASGFGFEGGVFTVIKKILLTTPATSFDLFTVPANCYYYPLSVVGRADEDITATNGNYFGVGVDASDRRVDFGVSAAAAASSKHSQNAGIQHINTAISANAAVTGGEVLKLTSVASSADGTAIASVMGGAGETITLKIEARMIGLFKNL